MTPGRAVVLNGRRVRWAQSLKRSTGLDPWSVHDLLGLFAPLSRLVFKSWFFLFYLIVHVSCLYSHLSVSVAVCISVSPPPLCPSQSGSGSHVASFITTDNTGEQA